MWRRFLSRAHAIYRNEGLATLASMGWKFWRHSVLPTITFSVSNYVRPKIHSVTYAAPAAPETVIWIDPDQIHLYHDGMTYKHGLARVESGRWDHEAEPLANHRTHRGLRQRFEEGLEWRETDYIPVGDELRSKWGDKADFVTNRCRYVDELYAEMEAVGYRPNSDGDNQSPPREVVPTRDLEPLVCIGRDGRLILHEGLHRVTIAQIVGIEQIPVAVIARHARWQAVRDEVQTASSLEDLSDRATTHLDHPDLADLVGLSTGP